MQSKFKYSICSKNMLPFLNYNVPWYLTINRWFSLFPSVKELLRFIYLGEIDPSSVSLYAKDLFIAAEKYGMTDLKQLCERHLVENLTVENAIEMYDLSQMHGSLVLLNKSKEVILWWDEILSWAEGGYACIYFHLFYDYRWSKTLYISVSRKCYRSQKFLNVYKYLEIFPPLF